MAVYFFYGNEDYNIELELKKMSSKLDPDFKSMNYQRIDNPDFTTIISAIRTTPMMFGNMLIIIHIEDYLLGNKKSFTDKELLEIEEGLKNNPQSLNIVFVVNIPRDENKKPDSRKKIFKILSKFNKKEFPTFKTYKINEISDWIKNCAKSKGLSIDDEAAKILIEQIGNNLREFNTELDKLKLVAYPETKISKDMVKNMCVSNEDLFSFTELIMKGEKDKALLEFKKLLDKKHVLEILSATQTMLKKWIIIKTKSSLSGNELSKLTGMHEFVVKQTLQKLKNTSTKDLVKLKENLFESEYKIKSAEAIDPIMEVESAIIR